MRLHEGFKHGEPPHGCKALLLSKLCSFQYLQTSRRAHPGLPSAPKLGVPASMYHWLYAFHLHCDPFLFRLFQLHIQCLLSLRMYMCTWKQPLAQQCTANLQSVSGVQLPSQ